MAGRNELPTDSYFAAPPQPRTRPPEFIIRNRQASPPSHRPSHLRRRPTGRPQPSARRAPCRPPPPPRPAHASPEGVHETKHHHHHPALRLPSLPPDDLSPFRISPKKTPGITNSHAPTPSNCSMAASETQSLNSRVSCWCLHTSPAHPPAVVVLLASGHLGGRPRPPPRRADPQRRAPRRRPRTGRSSATGMSHCCPPRGGGFAPSLMQRGCFVVLRRGCSCHPPERAGGRGSVPVAARNRCTMLFAPNGAPKPSASLLEAR